MKVTKWDIFFQLIIIGLFVGVLPAVTVGINYKEFGWLCAVLNFFILMIAFYIIHKYQVKKGILKESNMKTGEVKQIRETFQKIADMVTPTMGAKGRMAVLNDEFSRPILTDDGVTVAKEAMNLKEFERMIALSMIEAANNTEKKAYDGTTLTILLTNELYKQGLRWIKKGMHPQQAADKLLKEVSKVKTKLQEYRMDLTDKKVAQLALITTKMPMVAELVAQAHVASQATMNVIIEHDRKESLSSVEFTEGMTIDSGYMTEALKQLCNQDDETFYENAHLILLSENMITQSDLGDLFRSIPDDKIQEPFIFFVSNAFDPEILRLLLDTLVDNKMKFQMVFINDTRADEVFLDLAAFTDGKIQDPTMGTSSYVFEYAGFAKSIKIEQFKTIITVEKPGKEVPKRINSYKKELEDNKYNTGMNRYATITRRLSNLESGVTKIKVAVPTVTEYLTLKLKLDDAIGAVKCALNHGVVLGGGKTLWNISEHVPSLKKPLREPMKKIVKNAGLRLPKEVQKYNRLGLDVVSGKVVDLESEGIIDSYDSIETSLINAASIAANYLRAYILIKKD